MKALITGATGFIGSHLTERLLADGYEITVIVRKSSNRKWLKDLPIKIVECSFENLSEIEKVVSEQDYIFHVAGLTAAKSYVEFLKANRDVTENLLKACVNVNNNLKRFVLVSSQTVAGPAKSLDQPCLESDIPNPITSYGKSKKEGEDIAIKFMDRLPITIVRPPAVYGPRDTAIKDIFKTVKFGIGTLIGCNNKYVSLIHSEDLVRGIILAGISDNSIGEIYFITSNQFYTWTQIMDTMKSVFKKRFFIKIRIPHFFVLTLAFISGFLGKFSKKPPVFDYEKGIDFIQNFWICSPDKAKKDFGFFSEINLQKGIHDTADWYLKNKWI